MNTTDQAVESLQSLQTALQESAGNPVSGKGSRVAVAEGQPESGPDGQPGGMALPLSADPELMSDFFMECGDHLTSIESQLLTLERDPANNEAIHSVFRSFHTIKGLAGFLNFPEMQDVAHETETLLDGARQQSLTITPAIIDVILASADHLKREMERLQAIAGGQKAGPPADPGPLLEVVRAARSGELSAAPREPAEARETPSAASTSNPQKSAAVESRLVKVDTSKLDFLVDMAGELAIAQSMIQHDGQLNAMANPRLQRNLAQLARITAEVQKTSMAMRMVPIGQLFQKSVRLVRDLMRKSGKKAEVEVSGEDTELDRTMVEQLSDPLMHMIRNSADHGIESPEDRIQAGKDPTGRVRVKAYHQAGYIVVEVGDDGRGLNRERILKKAVERGLIQDGATLNDKEVFNLIFEPGFSTAEKVTEVSGRGVGMDVVRKQVQKLRGRIDIESKPGKGATFFLRLPLTLAIIDGLVVKTGQERYVIPIYTVREIFRPKADARFTVEGRDEMLLVRGNVLPVTRLHERFHIAARNTSLEEAVVVVVETAAKSFCLVVDEVIGKQEVVIKSLGDMFKRLPGVSGSAILGDGRVGLILDMDTLLGNASHG